MLSTIRRMALLGAVCLVVVTAAGCSQRVNLLETGRVNVTVDRPAAIRIGGLTVRQGTQDVQVSGHIERVMYTEYPFAGRIAVELLHPDGRVLSSKDTFVSYRPSNRHGPLGTFFFVYFPGQLPEGTTVRVQYLAAGSHESSADNSMG